MSDRRRDEGATLHPGAASTAMLVHQGRAGRLALAAALMAGAAGCSSSPQYPINVGERAGDGSVIAVQPRYPISAADAAQNAADRNAQNGAPAPPSDPYATPPAAAAAPPADAQDDDAPKALPGSSVDSSDLPPPAATPDDGAPQPHAISWGGGRIVFGTDTADAGALVFAAYHHHRHTAVTTANDPTPADDARPAHRRHHGRAAADEAVAPAAAVADTPYQTVVKPGETLSKVAERTHSSRDALVALNDLKRPRHVKTGTVLKIPYRYTYDVQKGDTLYTIAKRFDQDPQAVARLNGLKTAPTLQPGQSIALPPTAADQGKRDHASAAEPVPVAAPPKLAEKALRRTDRRGRRHTLEETAEAAPAAAPSSRTGRRHGRLAATEAEITPAAPSRVAPPDRAAAEVAADAAAPLTIPPATAPAVASATSSASRAVPTAPRSVAAAMPAHGPVTPPGPVSAVMAATAGGSNYAGVRPYAAPAPTYRAAAAPTPSTYTAPGYVAPGYAAGAQSGRVASLTPPRAMPGYAANSFTPSLGRERPAAPMAAGGALTPPQIAAAGRGRFIWPLRGAVISPFGDRGAGEHNDGVDIAASTGAGVRAAAAGEVVYAGSSIPGFGNLVLVKHAGGWVTAYAHLDRIEVRMRDSVAQGEEIGLAGQTGAVERSELHFEVRYAPDPTDKARPVDPTLVLPAG